MTLILTSIAIAALALVLGWMGRRPRAAREAESFGTDGEGGARAFKVAAVLLVCEVLGVAASFYLTQTVLRPGQNVLVLSLIIAGANFAGALQGRGSLNDPLRPTELFQFFKDGLLWPTALPVLAETLGTTPPAA